MIRNIQSAKLRKINASMGTLAPWQFMTLGSTLFPLLLTLAGLPHPHFSAAARRKARSLRILLRPKSGYAISIIL